MLYGGHPYLSVGMFIRKVDMRTVFFATVFIRKVDMRTVFFATVFMIVLLVLGASSISASPT